MGRLVNIPEGEPQASAQSSGTESVDAYPEEADAGTDRPERLAPGDRVAGRYTIVSVLGKGGYAVVYLANDEMTGTAVAVKVLRAERVDPVSLRRMAREAETARTFDHPNLVRVVDHGREGDNAFLVMEAVDGPTLRERMRASRLSTDEGVAIASDILSALKALHERGIVHRDVKPSNILLDRNGRAKLADFGLVTRWAEGQSRATQSHAVVGTLEYVSPEQALGEELDGRSDLYSLGVVLYELLSGTALHGNRSSLGMLVAHLTKPAPDVRASRKSVPDWLAAVVARLLAKGRDERYATAEAVLADLKNRAAVAGPIAARAQRRRTTGAAALLTAGVLLALGWKARPTRFPVPPARPLARVEVKGGVLNGLDEKGAVMWTGRFTAPLDDGAYSSTAPRKIPKLRVADIDGDGANEVLLIVDDGESASSLVAYNADGSVRFRRQPGRSVTYGSDEYANFGAEGTYFYVDRHGKRRLFLLATHRRDFPSVLEEIDDQGHLLSEYFANGRQTFLTRLTVKDEDALALNGDHAETRGGSVTFLSLDHPSGRAPAADPYFRCTNCPQEDPLAIVLLPRTGVVVAAAGAEGSAQAGSAREATGGVIQLDNEQGDFVDLDGQIRSASVAYTLSSDLTRLVTVRPSEFLTAMHNRFFKAGRLDRPWGFDDDAKLRLVRIWDGHGWAPIPERR